MSRLGPVHRSDWLIPAELPFSAVEAILNGLQIILCVVLIVLILLHSGKDSGLSGAFGVGTGAGPFGARPSLVERTQPLDDRVRADLRRERVHPAEDLAAPQGDRAPQDLDGLAARSRSTARQSAWERLAHLTTELRVLVSLYLASLAAWSSSRRAFLEPLFGSRPGQRSYENDSNQSCQEDQCEPVFHEVVFAPYYGVKVNLRASSRPIRAA